MHYGDLPSDESSVTLSDADQQKIMHVSLLINASTILMASNTNDQFCAQSNTFFTVGNNHYNSINLDAHEQADAKRLFDALSVNGKIEITFWGALYGAFTDQFGVKWMVNCQLQEG